MREYGQEKSGKQIEEQNVKKRLLCLERTLSSLEGCEGWMIGSCVLFLDGQAAGLSGRREPVLEMLRRGHSAIRVRISVSGEAAKADWLEVLLVKPRGHIPALGESGRRRIEADAGMEKRNECGKQMCFEREEMEKFLEEAGDTNPIHQGDGAVLPGFLLLNKCLLRLLAEGWSRLGETLEARFIAPLYPREAVVLEKAGNAGREPMASVKANRMRLRTCLPESREILTIEKKQNVN